MNKIIIIAWNAGSLICSALLNAATLIETMESDGEAQKIWIEGTKMLIDSGEGYDLADMEKRKMYFVSPEDERKFRLSSIPSFSTQ